MTMASLIPYAERLARNPPLKVYDKLMELLVTQGLDAPPREPAADASDEVKNFYKNRLKEHEQLKKDALESVNSWAKLETAMGKPVALFSVSSICDFNAMCTMMIAAGSTRIEAMKAAIRGKNVATDVNTGNRDHAHLLIKGAKQFEKIMGDWSKQKGNGIVQLKFPANSDFHTFTIERVPATNGLSEFIIYQSYQSTYSLEHFLGLKLPEEDGAFDSYHLAKWENLFKATYTTFNGYLEAEVRPQMVNIRAAKTFVGEEQQLSYSELKNYVLDPLSKMLSAGTEKYRYVRMTGSPQLKNKDYAHATYMILLVCDEVSPQEYQANFDALYAVPADLTSYLDSGIT